MDRKPAISVFMPVRDAADYLDESVASILAQSDPDFELVIVDDGSTDGSRAILRRWARGDPRIRLIESDARLGAVGAPNVAVRESRAPLCARMDADDVAHPDRLRRQRQVLTDDPSVALVGALGVGIDRRGRPLRPRDRWRLLRPAPTPPFPHASIMFRRALFLDIGGYREDCEVWEDVDLCRRLAERGRVMVLPAALHLYRFHAASATLKRSDGDLAGVIDRMHDHLAAARPRGSRAETLHYVAGSRLWAGVAPAYTGRWRDLPWRRPALASLQLLLIATWGRWSPASLRAVLRGAIALRDRAAAPFLAGERPVEWRCG
jgi:glycosyltransferase involved in cell wall biosynthesis